MRSWADRSPTHVTKDAPDLALACQWYTDSSEIQEQLWEDAKLTQGTSILEKLNFDLELASVAVLSSEITRCLSASVRSALSADWNDSDLVNFSRDFSVNTFSSAMMSRQEERDRRVEILRTHGSALE